MGGDYQEQPATTIPEPRPEPASTSKPKRKSKSKKDEAEKSMKSAKEIQDNVISWLDNDNTPEVPWFDALIKAQPPLSLDEEPLPGNTLQYTQKIMQGLNIDTLTKKELRRIKRDAFDFLVKQSGSTIELEYQLENIALAMNDRFDWRQPGVNLSFDPTKYFPYVTN